MVAGRWMPALLFCPKPITNSRFCDDITWAGWIRLDLPTQIAHIHTQQVRLALIGTPPYLAEKLMVG